MGEPSLTPEDPSKADPRHRSRWRVASLPFLGSVAIIASLIFVITTYALGHVVDGVPQSISVIFSFVVLLALGLAIIVLANLADVFRESRAGLRGARLHKRMVLLLLTVGVIPTLLAFALTATVLKTFSDEYFVERVREANQVSKDFANGYLATESRDLGVELVQLRTDLALQAQSGLSPETQPVGFRRYLFGQAVLRGLSSVVLLDKDLRIVAEVNRRKEGRYRLPPLMDYRELSVPGATPYKFAAHDQDTFDAWYALLKVGAPQFEYIVAYRAENPMLSEQLLSVRAFRDETRDIRVRLRDLESTFAIGYGLAVVVFLLGAMWAGVTVANAIIGPVRRLAVAAGAVSEGDLTSRVDVRPGDGELGELGEAFNDMIRQLEAQRHDLLTAHEQSDARRRFIEAVVSGVPAGVLNVGADGRIVLANPSAGRILGKPVADLHGAAIDEAAPELSGLFTEVRGSVGSPVLDQVEMGRKGLTRIINVRISPDDPERSTGFLVTLDDITELVAAQRNAAWGEVARRIAHEIKNPLTPIQLSAERLRRRYRDKLGEEHEVFDQCTDTIIRHVKDIGRMVNEFSSFARMPEPIISRQDVSEVVKSATFSFKVANAAITFDYHFPEEPVFADCDGRLLGQAVVNLVKNAVEAITEGDISEPGVIDISVAPLEEAVMIEVRDNGRGLPSKERARLTEPYITTREKGTGLGLAIVRKAIEDHGGTFALQDRAGEGARGAIARITLPARADGGRASSGSTNDERAKPARVEA